MAAKKPRLTSDVGKSHLVKLANELLLTATGAIDDGKIERATQRVADAMALLAVAYKAQDLPGIHYPSPLGFRVDPISPAALEFARDGDYPAIYKRAQMFYGPESQTMARQSALEAKAVGQAADVPEE